MGNRVSQIVDTFHLIIGTLWRATTILWIVLLAVCSLLNYYCITSGGMDQVGFLWEYTAGLNNQHCLLTVLLKKPIRFALTLASPHLYQHVLLLSFMLICFQTTTDLRKILLGSHIWSRNVNLLLRTG